jgi:DNA-binding CsgD family transcriptional regulator
MHAPQGFPTALLRAAQGKLAASGGDRVAAADAFIECGWTLDAMRVSSPGVLPWRSELARLLVDDGELERARELAQTELDLARTLAGPAAAARALHVLALTYERPQRVALLRNAREILVGSRALLTHAAVTVELGVTLRHLREAADARTFLTEGHALAAQCRCAPMVTRAREELAMLGVAPRRASAFGPEALTPGEIRVARLAAQGKSNAEIAQHLFVTRKTIEKHLASAYRKLGIESRTQLGDAIEL